ncbi:MAG: N4-gp56 family major capsid protein [Candidatus Anstonellales archaeon]
MSDLIIKTSDLNAGILQEYLNRKTIENLDKTCKFVQFGEKPVVQQGYNTIRWAKFTRLTASNVSQLSEGTNPDGVDFDATSVTATPTQYGIVVKLTDLTMANTVIPFLKGAAERVGVALAEKIDTAIQASLLSTATNIKYGPTFNRAYPTDVTSADKVTGASLAKWYAFLKDKGAIPFDADGAYVAIVDVPVYYDLMTDTATGSWIDVNKYATPDKIFAGEVGKLNGIRIVVSNNITTINSTVTLHPVYVFGKGAYGVANWQDVEVLISPDQPSTANPLNLYRTVGGKVAFGTAILQNDALLIVEVAASTIS